MNIKDMYLHGGNNIVKNITFSIPSSGTNSGKLVATITWAKEGAETTTTAIPINTSIFGSVTKNTVLAGPNGSNGNPSFRALVAADIPDLAASKIASGVFDAARLPLASNSAKGTIILGAAQTSDQDSAITGKKYWVKMNANGKLFVDIPWADNTHYTAVPILGGSTATSNATSDTANDATYLNIIENSTKSGGIQITGSGATTVKANGGVLTINSTNSTYTGYNIAFQNNAGTTVDTFKALTSPSKTLKAGTNVQMTAASNVITITATDTWNANAVGVAGYVAAPTKTANANMTWQTDADGNPAWRASNNHSHSYLPLSGANYNTNTGANPFTISRLGGTTEAMSITLDDNSTLFKYTNDEYNSRIVFQLINTDTSGGDGSKASDRNVTIASSNTGISLSVGGTQVSLNGHKHAYTDLTGSTTTADQAIVSSGTANGWTLKTLGSRAFDSTSYLPLSGGTMTGPIDVGVEAIANTSTVGLNFGNKARIANGTSNFGILATGLIYIRPEQTVTDGSFANTNGLVLSGTAAKFNGYTIYHSGNIPSNSASAKGVVPAGVASSVYMTDASKNPSWTSIDTTVTSGSSHLVTSGAVYTAIANNVASAVQYQGTITSAADMIALTDAGKGDFARVTTAFTFTDATGASVTAHVGDVVYLTNNTPGTSSNWIVAHTEIDTNTWTAASTSAAGYVPKLTTGGANLAAASTDYVLAFTNGATSPSWLKLPANAYKNDNTTGVKLATVSGTKKTDSTLIKIASGTGLSIAGGTNKFSIGDGTNYIEVSVAHGLSTKNININGTNYALYTSASSLPTIKAPTAFGTANQILATNADANGLTWVDKPATNVTTSLYIGASNGTETTAQTAGNVYLILKEGNTYTRYNITGSGRASVTSDANGKITINSAGYSNFVKSGSGAAAGLVPSPGTTAGTGKFLCEDGTWKTPSYTTNTDEKVKQIETTTTNYRGVVLGYNTNAAANTGVTAEAVGPVYVSNNLTVQPSTGSIVSLGRGTFAGLTSSNGDLIFNAVNHILWNSGSYHQRIFLTDDATADTAVFTFQQSSDSGSNWANLMTIKDNGKVVATTFVGALSGNASTATNLKETNMRGWLYQDGDASTNGTGIGTRSTTGDNSIGIPIIHHISSSNDTYVLMKTLFRKTQADSVAASSIYIGDSIRSNKFACVKSKDSTTDDWNGSSTSGSSGSGSTTYSAGDGISISNGVISSTKKEWYGTEAQFDSLASLDSNTTYYIMN